MSDAITDAVLPADAKQAQTRLARQLRTSSTSLASRLSRASSAERQRHSDALQDGFEADARRLAGELVKSGDVAKWQRKMGARVIQHMVEQRTLGAGRPLRESELRQMGAAVKEQLAYLSRFADEVAVRGLQGKPLSEAAIAQRAAMYGGVGRAAYSYGAESEYTSRPGFVSYYDAKDDDHCCLRCIEAEARGPYLVGQGPLPGSVCLGRHRCRCTRRVVYDPAAWERLTGRVAA